MAMLEVDGLSTGYGKVEVVHDVSFSVAEKSITAIVGNNGAGKTTLLKCIVGLLPVMSGSVRFKGEDIGHLHANRRVRKGMAFVPQGQLSFGQLTVDENLRLVADRYGKESKSRYDQALESFPILKEFRSRRAGLLSGGQRQQLSIARALETRPSLMILDEPTEGIQPNIVAEIQQSILDMVEQQGISVVLVEQKVQFAVGMAQVYHVLASGRITKSGEGGAEAVEVARKSLML